MIPSKCESAGFTCMAMGMRPFSGCSYSKQSGAAMCCVLFLITLAGIPSIIAWSTRNIFPFFSRRDEETLLDPLFQESIVFKKEKKLNSHLEFLLQRGCRYQRRLHHVSSDTEVWGQLHAPGNHPWVWTIEELVPIKPVFFPVVHGVF